MDLSNLERIPELCELRELICGKKMNRKHRAYFYITNLHKQKRQNMIMVIMVDMTFLERELFTYLLACNESLMFEVKNSQAGVPVPTDP